MTITIPPELEQVLIRRAEQQGATPEMLVLEALNQLFARASKNGIASPSPWPGWEDESTEPIPGGQSMADVLGDLIGSIDSSEFVPGGAQMSRGIGKKFAAGMLEKHQQRRL